MARFPGGGTVDLSGVEGKIDDEKGERESDVSSLADSVDTVQSQSIDRDEAEEAARKAADAAEVTARNAAISAAIDAVVDGAPGALDTLKELATAAESDASGIAALVTSVAGKASKGEVLTEKERAEVAEALRSTKTETTSAVNVEKGRAETAEGLRATKTELGTEKSRAEAAEVLKAAKTELVPAAVTLGQAVLTADPAYGCKCDAKTLGDAVMTSGSKILTNASGAYVSGDVGKLAVVCGAGASVNSAGKLSGTLGTGGAITTMAVSALAAAIPSGPITLEQEGHTQQFFCNGAAAGATALPVNSQTPNFAYTSAASIKSWAYPLFSKIAAVNSATEIELETAASMTLSSTFPGEIVYGTDNQTGLEAAITAAAGRQLVITHGPGEGFMHAGTLKLANGGSVIGLGVHGNFGTFGTSANSGNFPQTAPYLYGSVLIQAGSEVDAIQVTGAGVSIDADSFGIRFAGKYLKTGHGINTLPPLTESTKRDNGQMASSFKRLKVFGHDGNHYAYIWTNSIGCTDDSCQSYGGGGTHWVQNTTTSDQYGNHTSTKLVSMVVCGGTAHAMSIDNTAGSGIFNMFRFVGAQPHFDQAIPHITGAILPTSSQSMFESSGRVDKVVWVGGEGNAGATSKIPNFELTGSECGHGSIMGYGGAVTNYGTGKNGTPTSVFTQNVGTLLLYTMVWDLLPSPIANANVTMNESSVVGMTSPFVMAEETIPAAAVTASFTLSSEIKVADGARTTLPVNAIPAALAKESWVTVVAGSSSQQWKLSAEAAAGATSLTVTSQTPNATYATSSGVYPAHRRNISTFLLPGWFYQAVATNAKFISRQSMGVAGS